MEAKSGESNTPQNETNVSSSENNPDKDTTNSLIFFPERRGGKIVRSNFQKYFLGENKDNLRKLKCERNVIKAIDRSPLLKLLVSALTSSGCDITLNRHVVCEPCSDIVNGGYDPELNQIVVCQNNLFNFSLVQGVLAHEMIHMFDFCRANLDFKNIDHLMCTEIRAANLMHCSFMSAMMIGTASPFNVKQRHQECVKKKALASVMAVRSISEVEAKESLDRVFVKCYNDLEPLGRRLRRNSFDHERAYRERFHYNYG